MLHMDGSNGSTTFTDSELAPTKTVTANGSAQLSTAQAKFGTASGLFASATSDYLSIANSTDFDFGSGDFTIDFWIYVSGNQSSTVSLFHKVVDDNNRLRVLWVATDEAGGGRLVIRSVDNAVNTTAITTSHFVPTQNVWHHLAYVRSGNFIKFFVDGTQLDSDVAFNTTIPVLNGSSYIGSEQQTGVTVNFLDGRLDEFRISKGIARWTSNFTPDTSPYSSATTTTSNGLFNMGEF